MNIAILKDLKVVELASVLAGPAVGMFFAELGADVIKIENKTKGGDVTRQWKHSSEQATESYSAYYHSVNWGKKSILLDLQNSEDRKLLEQKLQDADIVISNYLPKTAKKLRLRYSDIIKLNKDIIYGHISAYSKDDPRPGFDALMQAETGWMHMNGQAEGPPTKMPVALIDILAAHQLKQGILLAYINKLKTGAGSEVSVSLFDTAVASLANQASNFLNLNIIAQRKGSLHPNIAPYGEIIKSKNGDLLLLAIGNDKQFQNLLNILEIKNISSKEKFKDNISRVKNRKELLAIIQTAAAKFTSKEILTLSEQNAIPIGLINNLKQVFQNKMANDLILTESHNDGSISKRVKSTIFKLTEQ